MVPPFCAAADAGTAYGAQDTAMKRKDRAVRTAPRAVAPAFRRKRAVRACYRYSQRSATRGLMAAARRAGGHSANVMIARRSSVIPA